MKNNLPEPFPENYDGNWRGYQPIIVAITHRGCKDCGESDWVEEIYLWRPLTDMEIDILNKSETSEEIHAFLELLK